MAKRSVFTNGGTVQASDGTYLPRNADKVLFDLCCEGEFAYVLSSRQVGKSSLMVQTKRRLVEVDIQSVIVDLSGIGTKSKPGQWYLGLLTRIKDQLALETDVLHWWKAHQHLAPTDRLTQFIQTVVLKEVDQQIVIFVDEIDTTRKLDFSDDFFVSIRAMHNLRADIPAFKRLSFVLIGVATPIQLISDLERTPFNIGERVDLADFTFEDALPFAEGLAEGLSLTLGQAKQVMRWVLNWTEGHPYLTQSLCVALLASTDVSNKILNRATVDRAVKDTFFGEKGEHNVNLQFVENRLLQHNLNLETLLKTYRKVYQGKKVLDEENSEIQDQLKLAGIVQRQGSFLRVRNKIYREVFNRQWIKEHLPKSPQYYKKMIALSLGSVIITAAIALGVIKKTVEASGKVETLISQAVQSEESDTALVKAIRAASESKTQLLSLQPLSLSVLYSFFDVLTTAREKSILDTKQTKINLPIRSIALDKNGARIAVVASNEFGDTNQSGNLILINVENIQSNKKLDRRSYPFPIYSVAFSPDGHKVAIGCGDNMIHLWDVQGDKLVNEKELNGHRDVVYSVAFSPDGKQIASGSSDGTVRLWDLTGSSAKPIVFSVPETVLSVAFNPDGKTIVSAGDKKFSAENRNVIDLWDVSNSRVQKLSDSQPQELSAMHDHVIESVVFTQDRKIVSSSRDRTVHSWDMQTGQTAGLQWTGNKDYAAPIALSRTRAIAIARQDGVVQLWDSTLSQLIWQSTRSNKPIEAVAFSGDGNTIATGDESGTLRFWDLKDLPGGNQQDDTKDRRKSFIEKASLDDGLRIACDRLKFNPVFNPSKDPDAVQAKQICQAMWDSQAAQPK